MDRRTRILEAEARAGDRDAARELERIRTTESGESIRPLWVVELGGLSHVAMSAGRTACGSVILTPESDWLGWAGVGELPMLESACLECHDVLVGMDRWQFLRAVVGMIKECSDAGGEVPSREVMGLGWMYPSLTWGLGSVESPMPWR